MGRGLHCCLCLSIQGTTVGTLRGGGVLSVRRLSNVSVNVPRRSVSRRRRRRQGGLLLRGLRGLPRRRLRIIETIVVRGGGCGRITRRLRVSIGALGARLAETLGRLEGRCGLRSLFCWGWVFLLFLSPVCWFKLSFVGEGWSVGGRGPGGGGGSFRCCVTRQGRRFHYRCSRRHS